MWARTGHLTLRGLVWLAGVVVAALIGGFITVAMTRPGASCDEPGDLEPVTDSPTATATSTLIDSRRRHYEAALAVDGDPKTAWSEGVHPAVAGETITFQFARAVDLQLVCVVNGYAKSKTLYEQNPRLQLVDVSTNQGRTRQRLRDLPEEQFRVPQKLGIKAGPTTLLIIKIEKAFLGDKYDDVSLSEVEFYRGNKPWWKPWG